MLSVIHIISLLQFLGLIHFLQHHFQFSLAMLIISAPLKLRPYGAIQICLLLLLLLTMWCDWWVYSISHCCSTNSWITSQWRLVSSCQDAVNTCCGYKTCIRTGNWRVKTRGEQLAVDLVDVERVQCGDGLGTWSLASVLQWCMVCRWCRHMNSG